MEKVCSIDGCDKKTLARGWCDKHYMRWYTHGTPHHTNDLSTEERFWAKVDRGKPNECWHWTASRNHKGYGIFRREEKQKTSAHRYSYVLHNDEIPSGMVVMHSCDQPSCVNPAHLQLGTIAENNADAARKGRKRGQFNPNRKLTQDQVLSIRSRYALGDISQKQLSKDYGVDPSSIQHIVRRTVWKHI